MDRFKLASFGGSFLCILLPINKFDIHIYMVIQSGTLLYGVSTWNNAPIPSVTLDKNSTRVSAGQFRKEVFIEI